jgi:hypothetical protein
LIIVWFFSKLPFRFRGCYLARRRQILR